MWINKREIEQLSKDIKSAADGNNVDFRDNREGPFSALKNDIYTLLKGKNDAMDSAQLERNKMEEYISDISHQLKTPITSSMIMTELIENASAEKQREFAENIKSSLSRMDWLVSTLLKMARLDSGTVEFIPADISVNDIVKEALKSLEILLDVKNQTVEIIGDTVIQCDKRWTIEALTNIIKNASEHSPENSQITIGGGENPIYKWISIMDSGSGFKKEQYSALFKRFEYSTGEKGYGIGMPLALSIMKGQNGDIDIDFGGNGKGTTFIMKFYR